MDQEIWKDIPWYEWLYQVSNLGRVKSLDRYIKHNYSWYRKKYWIIISNKWNYWNLWLHKYWKTKYFRTHRLVAQAFLWLDINDKKILVCHKDDNPKNNCVENLFLWTNKDNIQDCIRKKRFKLPPLQIKYWKDFHIKIIDFTNKWLSTRKIAKILWVSKSNINFIQHKYI